jgi:hypothetical protein
MVRAACAATTCAPAPRSSAVSASPWQNRRSALRAYHLFTLRACQRQGRRVCSIHHRDFLIGSFAIKNPRILLQQHAMLFSNPSKIACLRAPFAPLASLFSHRASALLGFLIATGPELKFDVTHSRETRKYFLIATFSVLFSASCLAKPSEFHSRPPQERRNPSFSTDAPSSESQSPPNARL